MLSPQLTDLADRLQKAQADQRKHYLESAYYRGLTGERETARYRNIRQSLTCITGEIIQQLLAEHNAANLRSSIHADYRAICAD